MADETQSWQVGDATVTAVVEQEFDGIPPELFFPEATQEDVLGQEWLGVHAGADGSVGMRVQAFVVELPGVTALIDPCVGNGKRRELPFWDDQRFPWFERFLAAGFDPDAVDVVVHTHLHADHVGWDTVARDGAWRPTFPNARYVYVRDELDHWRSDGSADAAAIDEDSIEPILAAGLAELVDPDAEPAPGLRLVPAPGHTPGHVALELTSGDTTAVITGDLVHHPVQLARPEWREIGDVDPELARETRTAFFDAHARAGTLVFGTHFAHHPAGRIVRAGPNWRFESVAKRLHP